MPERHLLDTSGLTAEDIVAILDDASSFLTDESDPRGVRGALAPELAGRSVVLAFFETSTRTRLSFDVAARNLGATTFLFQPQGSSTEKGETLMDTMHTIAAMGCDCIVLRHGVNGTHADVARSTPMQVVNAGEGTVAHPTQGLLDASTLRQRFGSLAGLRICLVGDVAHSRVARSQVDVVHKLGATVAMCAPADFCPTDGPLAALPRLSSIDEALEWCDVISLLRIQRERLPSTLAVDLADYRRRYALTMDRARHHHDVTIIHPGPVNVGVEIDAEVLTCPQSLVRRQVSHGVAVRMAVLRRLLRS